MKIKTRAPQRFTVLGQPFNVTFHKRLSSKEHGVLNGWTRVDRAEICLAIKDISDAKRVETYLHEALHALFSTARIADHGDGGSITEESLIACLAPHLMDFMRTNPDVVAYIMQGDADAPAKA